MKEYKIQKGDKLSKLAEKWGCTVKDIQKVNPSITDPDIIFVGQTIRIPNTSSNELETLLKACVKDIQNLNSFKKVMSYLE